MKFNSLETILFFLYFYNQKEIDLGLNFAIRVLNILLPYPDLDY